MLLHGIFPPITTPFYPDGNVYFKKLEAMSSATRGRPSPALLCSARRARRSCCPIRSGAMC